MTRTSKCRLCNRTIVFDGAKFKVKHFCDDPCRGLRKKQLAEEKKARERGLTATLNKGVELGKSNKDLTQRLAPLVLRSYAEVGKILALSPQAVRLVELRAINKLRKLLMPYKNALSGTDKVRQITAPVASLED